MPRRPRYTTPIIAGTLARSSHRVSSSVITIGWQGKALMNLHNMMHYNYGDLWMGCLRSRRPQTEEKHQLIRTVPQRLVYVAIET